MATEKTYTLALTSAQHLAAFGSAFVSRLWYFSVCVFLVHEHSSSFWTCVSSEFPYHPLARRNKALKLQTPTTWQLIESIGRLNFQRSGSEEASDKSDFLNTHTMHCAAYSCFTQFSSVLLKFCSIFSLLLDLHYCLRSYFLLHRSMFHGLECKSSRKVVSARSWIMDHIKILDSKAH